MHIHRKFWFSFFSGSNALFELWPKWKILLKQFISATPLKPLNRISWNFVVMKDLMCRSAYVQEILIKFFSRSYALFELLNSKWKIILKQFVSATPLKPLNRNCTSFVFQWVTALYCFLNKFWLGYRTFNALKIWDFANTEYLR